MPQQMAGLLANTQVSFKFSYNFVALFFSFTELFSIFPPYQKMKKFQCKNVQLDPPLWSMQILLFILFFSFCFFPFCSSQEKETRTE